ncbi:MAG: glycosyltransferase family A protein [Rhodospirillales bacterium]
MPRDPAPVSVIMPAYNAAGTIQRALASIAAQSLPAAEVIVVDDGSVDATAEIAERMAAALGATRLTVIRQPNKGAGAARNRAIQEATQPILAFLDADDEWLPAKLDRSLSVMNEGDYLLVAHDYLDATADGDVHVDCRRRFEEAPDPYLPLYLKGYIPSISVLTRRQAVLDAGGFDETLRNAQDFDLWLKLLADPGTRFTLFGEALARYHHSEGSIMTHTERRIACCTTIALRYAPVLKARQQPVYRSVLRRIANIHMEALRTQPRSSFRYVIRAVSAMIDACRILLNDPQIQIPETGKPAMRMETVIPALWVFGILVLYLVQFHGMARPILQSLGLTLPS